MASLDEVRRYHDGTKHHFNRFARSLGYLDWASQPNPFRAFNGAPVVSLPHGPFPAPGDAASVSAALVGDLLRHALGLSAWKSFRGSRWALRCNPSSGNLHPTEAYVVTGPAPDLCDRAAVWHYAPDRHAIERRCTLDPRAWPESRGAFLVALTSIHWREAWKYGERAFRYCQHDVGHAIAAVRVASALAGWSARLLPSWPQCDIARLTGIDREDDYAGAEREEPACALWLSREPGAPEPDRAALVAAAQAGVWTGCANRLSEGHVPWTAIDLVARATEDGGRSAAAPGTPVGSQGLPPAPTVAPAPEYSRALVLRRRSAVAFDAVSSTTVEAMTRMLAGVMAGPRAPWDALWWDARIHLALFVHRVEGLDPGLYLLPRAEGAGHRLRAAMRREFLWEPASDAIPLLRLVRGDARRLAERLSCDQEIASDGFFSLAMIADFDRSLDELGPSFYRHLFWESGLVGQALYLEAEAAGARGTGIGCFYDDPVHDALGLEGRAFQSLYHFTIGMPVEDTRLTTDAGYGWES